MLAQSFACCVFGWASPRLYEPGPGYRKPSLLVQRSLGPSGFDP